jgi:CheY-like chemotaxis protein
MGAHFHSMAPGGSSRILVVDDDPRVAGMIARVVKTLAEPVIASTAREGIDVLAGGEIAAGILDLRLPDGTAFDILAHATHDGGFLPSIVLTGEHDPLAACTARNLGAHYMIKPMDSSSVMSFVRRCAPPDSIHTGAGELAAEEPRSSAVRLVTGMADAGVADLRAQYAIGTFVHGLRYPGATEDHSPGEFADLAQRLGLHPSALRKRARVSETIQPEEFEGLVGLRTARGLPLTWSHMEKLALVRVRSHRGAIARQIVEQDLSVRESASLVRATSRRSRT